MRNGGNLVSVIVLKGPLRIECICPWTGALIPMGHEWLFLHDGTFRNRIVATEFFVLRMPNWVLVSITNECPRSGDIEYSDEYKNDTISNSIVN